MVKATKKNKRAKLKMKKKIFISTGGSGGHVLPAITIYDHLKSSYEILISSDLRGLKYIDKENYKPITINTPKLNNLFLLPFALFKALFLTFKCLILLKKEKISILVSTGGYMSLPLCLAAKVRNIKIFLLEPNMIIGRANRFFLNENDKEFFDDDGNNLQKAFLRAPLDFAYISSHFNPNRMHPVLHTIRAHNGVDYAAKTGSPVRTTGNGTVHYAGRRNGCGNEIVIKHSNDYSTRYCHLNKFKSGIKKGTKVIQGETIGFVGSTGLATGPHLHYEFKIGNKHVDPVKLQLPSAEPISQNLRSDFDKILKDNKLLLSKLDSLYPNKNE